MCVCVFFYLGGGLYSLSLSSVVFNNEPMFASSKPGHVGRKGFTELLAVFSEQVTMKDKLRHITNFKSLFEQKLIRFW